MIKLLILLNLLGSVSKTSVQSTQKLYVRTRTLNFEVLAEKEKESVKEPVSASSIIRSATVLTCMAGSALVPFVISFILESADRTRSIWSEDAGLFLASLMFTTGLTTAVHFVLAISTEKGTSLGTFLVAIARCVIDTFYLPLLLVLVKLLATNRSQLIAIFSVSLIRSLLCESEAERMLIKALNWSSLGLTFFDGPDFLSWIMFMNLFEWPFFQF